MSWLWSITNATHQVREHGDGLGRSAPLVSALLSGNHNRLSGIFHWSSILQGWSRPQIQHDVAAFATRALTRLRSPVMYGTWCAKREDPHCRVVDEGPLHLPLPIAIPAEAATLQECLDSWHQQDALHAVGVAPPLLALQLGRFRHRSHRHVRKYQGLLLLDEMVFIRVFGVGLDTQLQAYKPYSTWETLLLQATTGPSCVRLLVQGWVRIRMSHQASLIGPLRLMTVGRLANLSAMTMIRSLLMPT